jgi:predicted nuclease of predicted toxin-antitoxin system
MKFFIDANLPYKLALLLQAKGFAITHTDNLPNKERTSDNEIRAFAVKESSIVITKDADFLDSHLIKGIPAKLLYVATGNISNKLLLGLFEVHFTAIVALFAGYDLIELNNNGISIHEN